MKKFFATIIVSAVALSAVAEGSFFQLSLTPDIALQPRDATINGITLSIWGENRQSAFALGFINGSTGDSAGVSLGLVNYAENYTGVQWGTVNVAKHVSGMQWGMVNYTETLNGIQIGLANIVKENAWFDKFPDQLAKGFVFVNWSF